MTETVIVEKKVFHLPEFTTFGGSSIPDVRVGYETLGELNAEANNAIFVCPYSLGTAHFAGKYRETDKVSGYWDSIIGPGKVIDTNKYFVVSTDGLCNPFAKDSTVTTTGPTSTDPRTGVAYGLNFPVITIPDQAKLQKALCDHLGIKKLKMVIGASLGGACALAWGAMYPDAMERLVPIVGFGLRAEPLLLLLNAHQDDAIRSNAVWNKGDYHGTKEPLQAVKEAVRRTLLLAYSANWAMSNGGREPATPGREPAHSVLNRFAVESKLDLIAQWIAIKIDANHYLYQHRSEALFDLTGVASAIKVPVLFIVESSDILTPPSYSEDAARVLNAQGTDARVVDLKTGEGHYAFVVAIDKAITHIGDFLQESGAPIRAASAR